MRRQRVKISLIDIPEIRVNAEYDDETSLLLKKTIEAVGVVTPVILVKIGQRYEVVDGRHRIEELIAQGETEIEASVYEGDGAESLCLNLMLNRTRGKVRPSNMVRVIRELMTKYGLGVEDIEKKTGLPRGYLEGLMVIATASPSLREAVEQDRIGIGVAKNIARLPNELQQAEMVNVAIAYKMTVAQSEDYVSDVINLQPSPDEPPAPPPTPIVPKWPECGVCRKECDPAVIRAIPLDPQCYALVWSVRQKQIEAEEAAAKDKSSAGG